MLTINETIKPIVEKAINRRIEQLEQAKAPSVIIDSLKTALSNPLRLVKGSSDQIVISVEERKTGLIMHLQDNPNKAVLVVSKHTKQMFELKWMLPHQIEGIK